MKKMTILMGSMLLVSSHAVAADLANSESTQFQEETTLQYQARLQSDGTEALLQAMQRNQFRNKTLVQVRNMIEEAQEKGLPSDPMVHKVYEGMVKKVSEEKIVQAVKRVQNRYENAYRQANSLISDSEEAKELGQVIAEAYTAGLTEEDAAQIMSQLQTRTKTENMQEANELMVQTMATARVMARRGVDSTTAADVLVNALQHAYQAREMRMLEKSFVEQTRYGSPEDVASDFSADISQDVAPAELRVRSSDNGFMKAGSGTDSARGSGGSDGAGGSGGSDGAGGSGGSDGAGGSGGSDSAGGSGGSDSAGGSGGSGGFGGSGGSGGSSSRR